MPVFPAPGDYQFADIIVNAGTYSAAGTFKNVRNFILKPGATINVIPWDGAPLDTKGIPTSDTGHFSVFARDIVIKGTIDATGAGGNGGGGGGGGGANSPNADPIFTGYGPGGPGGPGAENGGDGTGGSNIECGLGGDGGAGAGTFPGTRAEFNNFPACSAAGAAGTPGGYGASFPGTPTGVKGSRTDVAGGSLISGTTYYYVVSAVFAGNVEGLPSHEVHASTRQSLTGNWGHSPNYLTITLSWVPVANAVSYNIYRSTTAGVYGGTSLLVNVATTSFVDDGTLTLQTGTPKPTIPSGLVATPVSGGTLSSGTTYYYKIAAFFQNGQEGFASAQASATPSGGNLSVSLSWTAVYGAAGYSIYRSTVSGVFNSPCFVKLTGGPAATDTGIAVSAGAPLTVVDGVNFDRTTDDSVFLGSGGSGGEGGSGGFSCPSCNFGSPAFGESGTGGGAGYSGGGLIRLVAWGSIHVSGILRSKDKPHGNGGGAGGPGGDGNVSGTSSGGSPVCNPASCSGPGGQGGAGSGGGILLEFKIAMSQVISSKRVEIVLGAVIDNRSSLGTVNGGTVKVLATLPVIEAGTIQTGRLYTAEPIPFGAVVSG